MKQSIIVSTMLVMIASLVFATGNGDTGTDSVETLKVLYNYNAQDMNADPTATLLEERTGQMVEYVTLPADNANEKLYIEVSSQVPYHAVKVNREQFDTLVSKGALMDLTDLIDRYGDNLNDVISDATWSAVTNVQGEILGIPEKNSYDNQNHGLIVRMDVLEAEGLALPQTTAEFVEVLETLKARGYEQPFAESRRTKDNGVAGAFGVANEWVEEDGSLMYYGASKGYKAYLDFMKDLNDRGLLGQDWPTDNSDATARFTQALADRPAVFMPFSWWAGPGILSTMESNGVVNPKESVAFIMSLEGPDGTQATFQDRGISYITVIPKYMVSTAAQVVQWIDARLEPELFEETVIGTEGYHYEMRNGEYWPILEENDEGQAKFDEKGQSSWFLMGTREDDYARMWQARVRKNELMYFAWNAMQQADYGVVNPLGYAPVLDAWTSARNSLGTTTTEFTEMYIAGTDDDYAGFIENLEAAGLNDAVKAVNGWYK